MISLKLKYFARYREALGLSEENLEVEQTCLVTDVIKLLADRNGKWKEIFSQNGKLLVAVNHELVSIQYSLQDGDELAFYPPVSGG